MATIADTSKCSTMTDSTDDVRSITLHDAELTSRLDALFARHFTRPRTPGFRVLLNHGLKRTLDIVVAALGLAVIWPVILISAIATLCDTGRPVFYSQVRRVRFGRRARIYKLRTLLVGSDRKLSALVNIKHNGRYLNITKDASSYTRVGRWLERLWIVEVPQLWNVLIGQMSLVGNRPLPDYVINTLDPTAEVAERFASPAGLTGYVQVIGRDHVTDEQRIRLEHRYSRVFETGNVFFEDFRIIALTVLSYLGIGAEIDFERVIGKDEATDFAVDQNKTALSTVPETTTAAQPMTISLDSIATLACPTCYDISASCDSTACQQQCVKRCEYDAIALVDGLPVINDKCTVCSECVVACPVQAIDKAPLRKTQDAVHCAKCDTSYPLKDGVFDLLPRKEILEKSPYFDFYENEYVPSNPEMHTEDTDWKLRELRPLLDGPGRYNSLFDLGCGAGVLGTIIADELHVDSRCSVDWSTSILAVARDHNKDGTFVRADAAHLPVRNGAFDLAMLIDVVEHQHKPDQVLVELSRSTRKMLFRTPLEDCAYERIRRNRKDLFHESSGHVVHYNLGSVRNQLERNGWNIRRQSVNHIAWSHWKRVLSGPTSFTGKATTLGRVALRHIMPKSIYRRLFVTNYNALCVSEFLKQGIRTASPSTQNERKRGED